MRFIKSKGKANVMWRYWPILSHRPIIFRTLLPNNLMLQALRAAKQPIVCIAS